MGCEHKSKSNEHSITVHSSVKVIEYESFIRKLQPATIHIHSVLNLAWDQSQGNRVNVVLWTQSDHR